MGLMCLDAVQEHCAKAAYYKKLVLGLLTGIIMGGFFAKFRFMTHSFGEVTQKVLKQTIEIGVFKADVGVVMGTCALNMGIFLLKYFVSLVRGHEITIVKFNASSFVLDIAVPDAVGGGGMQMIPPAVRGEVDAENDDTKAPGQVLDVPHDNAATHGDLSAVGDRKRSKEQGDTQDNGVQTDIVEVSYRYWGKRMTL